MYVRLPVGASENVKIYTRDDPMPTPHCNLLVFPSVKAQITASIFLDDYFYILQFIVRREI